LAPDVSMTLDEAVAHAERVGHNTIPGVGDAACAKEHLQLARWLKELQEWRSGQRRTGMDELNAEMQTSVYVQNLERRCRWARAALKLMERGICDTAEDALALAERMPVRQIKRILDE
jgi:hypothetical protein